MAMQKSPYLANTKIKEDVQLLPEDGTEAEIEVVDDDQFEYELEDGEYGDSYLEAAGFDDNLADGFIDDEKLKECSDYLIECFDADLASRADWERGYMEGLEYLGMANEVRSDPWEGACGVYHPLLTEAIVRFQSQAMIELFPASGPAKSQIVGKFTPEKEKQSQRVEAELNYTLTEKMSEYRWETEQLLFRVPLAGSCFRKIYFDPIEERPAAVMVPAEDFIVPYGSSDLRSAERYTHVMKKSHTELLRLQKTGLYKDIELDEPEPEYTQVEEKHDELTGQQPSMEHDTRHKLLEMHVNYDFEEDEYPLPYVITIEKSSGEILGIRRNWNEADPHKRKRVHFAHYAYMPGMGFYGIGLVHLIGGLAKSSTSILRQLIDSGTLANLPAGYKARGMRVHGGEEPFAPGEFRDVDVPGEDIGKNIYVFPFKEPSSTLYSLLGTVVDEGRRIASIADLEVGDMNQQAPVGTTLALLERSMKVMSAVHARLHAALRDELRLIAQIIGTYMPPEYDYDEEREFDRQQDFSSKIDILPVSDPNAATMSQRVVQMQAVFQMYQGNQELFDGPVLYRAMLEAMQVKDADKLVPMPEEMLPTDPVSENMALLNNRPVKAFLHQDHEAHIQAHMAAIMDPKILEMIGQSPRAAVIQGAAEAHIAEHLAYRYRQQIEEELGTQLPPPEEPLPPEVEVRLSRLVADAANRVFYRNKEEAQVKKNEQLLQDPVVQLQIREQELAESKFAHEQAMDVANLGEDKAQRYSREKIEAFKGAIELAKAEDDRLAAEAQQAAQIAGDFATTIAGKEMDTEKEKVKASAKPKPAPKKGAV